MVNLGHCEERVSSSVRRLFCSLLKQVYLRDHECHCSRDLHHIGDLSFLPHLMGVSTPWRSIQLNDLQTGLDERVLPYLSSPSIGGSQSSTRGGFYAS